MEQARIQELARTVLKFIGNLETIVKKAQQFCASHELDEKEFLSAKLYPNMLSLSRQIQIIHDAANGALARLMCAPLKESLEPEYAVFNRGNEDDFTEAPNSFNEVCEKMSLLSTRLARILNDYKQPIVDDKIYIRGSDGTRVFKVNSFINEYFLPNFYFHLSISYAILRNLGVPLGKDDFEGEPAYELVTASP